MAAVPTNSSIFVHFSSLPPELRNQIWSDALPDKDEPALFSYRKWCWHDCHLSKYDESYDPDDTDSIGLEFRHDLLDYAEVEVPLASVNREARGIALGWAREHGMKMQFRYNKQRHVFVRPFDPMCDALFVARNKIESFYSEPYDRLFRPDLVGRSITTGLANISRIAMTEALFRSEATTLHQVFDWFPCLAVLFIIVDAQPELDDGDRMVQRRWELESRQGRAFFWSRERGEFDMGDGEHTYDEAVYRQIKDASKGLHEWVKDNMPSFEIRPVLAVRR